MALELQDDEKFQRADWLMQRIGWLCILLIILGGAAGLAGEGPLSKSKVGDSAFRVEYDRIMRRGNPGKVDIYIGAAMLRDSVVRVWIDPLLIKGCNLQDVDPHPARMTLDNNKTVLDVRVAPRSDSAVVTLDCEPDEIGAYRGKMGVVGGPDQPLHVFTLP